MNAFRYRWAQKASPSLARWPGGMSRVLMRCYQRLFAGLIGEALTVQPLPERKKHGHREVSGFLLGIDHPQVLLLRLSGASWCTLIGLMPNFDW